MTHLDRPWHTAAGDQISAEEMQDVIRRHVFSGGRLFVGCDSNINGATCTYVTAICLYDPATATGGRYFFNREKIPVNPRMPLKLRLMEEATRSIETSLDLQGLIPSAQIEVHLDVSEHKDNPSSVVADQVSGYARAAGFNFKLKPDSWASSCVADEHTR